MSASSSRLSGLDGLRGVAALVVVIHHCFLVSPAFAAAYYGGASYQNPLRIALVYSPLHLIWGGAEAVVVFFVLSGFVLARSIRSRSFTWFGYFPSRMLRLYVPVVGAIVFAALIIMLPHDGAPASPWLDRAPGYPFSAMMRDITLLGGASGVVSPLWTLRWEVLFSLLLPVIAYGARLIPAWTFGLACVALSTIGAITDVGALQYLPIFGVGVALEGEWDRIGRTLDRVPHRARRVVWLIATAVAVVLLSMHWLLLGPLGHPAAVALSQTPIVLGAAFLVVAAGYCSLWRGVLTWRPIAWLGTISFSLYLIHEPIVIWMANLTDASRWTLVTAVPLALLTAWLFWFVAERPAHHLSRWVRGRAAASPLADTVGPAPAEPAENPDVGAPRELEKV